MTEDYFWLLTLFFPLCEFMRSNSGRQTWWQVVQHPECVTSKTWVCYLFYSIFKIGFPCAALSVLELAL